MFLPFHGSIGKPYSVGANNLIKKGAYLTTSYKDILEKFPEFLNRKRRNIGIISNKIIVKREYREIYSCLTNQFFSIDKIAQMSGKNIREVIDIITLMEIDGLVIFDFGKGYKKKEICV